MNTETHDCTKRGTQQLLGKSKDEHSLSTVIALGTLSHEIGLTNASGFSSFPFAMSSDNCSMTRARVFAKLLDVSMPSSPLSFFFILMLLPVSIRHCLGNENEKIEERVNEEGAICLSTEAIYLVIIPSQQTRTRRLRSNMRKQLNT